MTNFCGKCGSELTDSAEFCPKCGAAINQGFTSNALTIRKESKLSKKTIIILSLIAAIVIIIVVCLFLILNSKSDSLKGTWKLVATTNAYDELDNTEDTVPENFTLTFDDDRIYNSDGSKEYYRVVDERIYLANHKSDLNHSDKYVTIVKLTSSELVIDDHTSYYNYPSFKYMPRMYYKRV